MPFDAFSLCEDRFHFVVADGDAVFDLLALQPLPRDLAFDLAAQALDVRTILLEVGGELVGSLLHVTARRARPSCRYPPS